jgi:hypothetical protein
LIPYPATKKQLKYTDMATFKFYITLCEHGVIEVDADSFEDAKDKASAMDGKYLDYNTEVLDINLIGE